MHRVLPPLVPSTSPAALLCLLFYLLLVRNVLLGTYRSSPHSSISAIPPLLHFLFAVAVLVFLQLSLTLFSIIGGFWLLDSLKDTVLEGTVGLEYQPRAKLLSVAVTLLLVIQYNRLVDSCSKPTVSDKRTRQR